MQLLLLVLLGLLFSVGGVLRTVDFSTTGGEVLQYYVTPSSPNPDCPLGNIPCLTINEYAQNSSRLFGNRTNVQLLFLNGVHNLTTQSLQIQDVELMRMAGMKNSFSIDDPNVTIDILCSKCNLVFVNVTDLFVEALEISSNQSQHLLFVNVRNYTQTNVCLNLPTIFFNVQNLTLTKSKFVDSSVSLNTNSNPNYQHTQYSKSAGYLVEAKINISSCLLVNSDIVVTINTTNLDVSFGETNFYTSSQEQSNAYGLQLKVLSNSSVVLNVSRSNFFTQQGLSFLVVEQSMLDVTIENTMLIGNCLGGLIIYGGYYNVINVTIKASLFSGSNMPAISIDHKGPNKLQLIIEDSNITHIGNSGIVIQAANITIIKIQRSSITYCNGESLRLNALNSSEVLTVDVYESNITDSWYGIHAIYQCVNWQSSFNISHCNISNHRVNGFLISKGNNIEEGSIGGRLSLVILNTIISRNKGGGIHLEAALQNESGVTIYLQETHVFLNQFEGIFLAVKPPLSVNNYFNVTLDSCTISNTSGLSLGAYGISNYENNYTLVMKNVSFSQNSDITSTRLVTVQLTWPVTILDCTFEGNYGTPIQVVQSTLDILGNVKFVNNSGLKGGALSLEYSRLYVANNTRILFKNNTAIDTGGAIFVLSSRTFTLCFYQFPEFLNSRNPTIQLLFVNNSAVRGGSNLYGAALRENCIVSSKVTNSSVSVFERFFFFNDKLKPNLSPISSDPRRVCLCNDHGQPMCADVNYIFVNQTRFPGEKFNISAVVVGYEFGTVSSEIYANFIPRPNGTSFMNPKVSIQTVDSKQCSNLTYSVHSVHDETIVLTATAASLKFYDSSDVSYSIYEFNSTKVIPDVLLTTPVLINVAIDACPPGFNTSAPPITCDCNTLLQNNNINTCIVENGRGLISRSGAQWLGIQNNEVIVSKYCPFNYCRTKSIPIDLVDSDKQCSDRRTGILCGHCMDNCSMILGSTQCWPCSDDRYLSLLLAFIAAGFILVLVIKYLDLTVTNGTLNGLIFYANIVWAHQGMLLLTTSDNLLQQIPNTFIAWLNLDLGINTCFFVGLNSYWKTWLQFIFPVYIWIIAGLIILLCRCSILATKLFGKNSISVLATLFLLSFTKLLRTIITALNFTYVQTSNSYMVVWTEDGTVDYLEFGHAILVSVSVITLLFLWMPFMLALLFIQPLKKYAHIRPLRWVNKWKPLFDAYIGPLKDRYHYWIGLSLAARSILLLGNVILTPLAPKANLVAIVIVTAALGMYPFVYKSWGLSLLENSFFFNLVSLACGVLYAEYRHDNLMKTVVVSTSIGIAFFQFICILVFHVWRTIRSFIKKLRRRNIRMVGYSENIRQSCTHQEVTIQEHEHDGYREPLLSSTES